MISLEKLENRQGELEKLELEILEMAPFRKMYFVLTLLS